MDFELDDVEVKRIPIGDNKFVVLVMLKNDEAKQHMSFKEALEYSSKLILYGRGLNAQ